MILGVKPMVWLHHYLTHKWQNYFRYQWEKSISGSKPRNFTGGNTSAFSNLSSPERTAVKCHLRHSVTWKTLAQLSELAVTLQQGKEKALTPRETDIQTYSLKIWIPDMAKRPLFFLLIDCFIIKQNNKDKNLFFLLVAGPKPFE